MLGIELVLGLGLGLGIELGFGLEASEVIRVFSEFLNTHVIAFRSVLEISVPDRGLDDRVFLVTLFRVLARKLVIAECVPR